MSAHDIVRKDGTWLYCRCGLLFASVTVERSRERHLAHARLLEMRAVLEAKEQDDGA